MSVTSNQSINLTLHQLASFTACPLLYLKPGHKVGELYQSLHQIFASLLNQGCNMPALPMALSTAQQKFFLKK